MRTRCDGRMWIALLGAFMVLAAIPVAAHAQGVVVDATVSGNAVPGATLQGKATITIKDKSKFQKIEWIQKSGVAATINATASSKAKAKKDQKLTKTATIKLGSAAAYKHDLIEYLYEPPLEPGDLPPNVPVPPEEFPGGLQNRWQVVGISPLAAEEANVVEIQVKVTTSSGVYSDMLAIHTASGYEANAGIANVPVNRRVLLQGKEQASYNWTIVGPPGSTASFDDATSRNPWFVPNAPGNYVVSVTELPSTVVSFTIYAGEWRGVIVGQDANGRPIADDACTVCHSDRFAPDKFTPWAQTGHAEIFTSQVNDPNGHYGEGCLSCHTVGYDKAASNDGIDEAEGWNDFIKSGLLTHGSANNWTMILDQFPAVAAKANVQCENCHGPQEFFENVDSNAHGVNEVVDGSPRVTLSADNCAQCHGEPPRHGRYQQWQLSGHANYELAIDEGDSSNCSRCHTANGFLAWLPRLLDEDLANDDDPLPAGFDPEEVHPQTCVTCHDPHAVGTTTGVQTNATVRISGDSPVTLAGYQATAVGAGAICITCHNSRRALRNDNQPWNPALAGEAPHGGDQADLMMGENLYFVQAGVRGGHSFIEDTCVNCHMERTPPPAGLSYQQSGTNHTFYARPEVCSTCHTGMNPANLQHSVGEIAADLNKEIAKEFYDKIAAYTAAGLKVNNGHPVGNASRREITSISQVDYIVVNNTGRDGKPTGSSNPNHTIRIYLKDGTNFTGSLSTSSTSNPGGRLMVDDGTPAFFYSHEVANITLAKAFWNYLVIVTDGSGGVHNPTMAITALQAAREALGGGGNGAPKSLSSELEVWKNALKK